jgi:hypothetical protein
MSALDILDQVPEFARCVALELSRIMEPHKDEISTNEAYLKYGRGWVEKYTKMKQLNPHSKGNRKMYSVSELERVKAKENVAARLVIK